MNISVVDALRDEHFVAGKLDVSVGTVRAGRQGKGALRTLKFLKMGGRVGYTDEHIAEFKAAAVIDPSNRQPEAVPSARGRAPKAGTRRPRKVVPVVKAKPRRSAGERRAAP